MVEKPADQDEHAGHHHGHAHGRIDTKNPGPGGRGFLVCAVATHQQV